MNTHIEKAVAIVGSQAALARLIGTSQPFVNDMLHERKRVPADLCIPIEKAAKGAVTRYDLRPGAFGEAPVKSKKVRVA
jgi:DNA-binding transcriptional regulator YdaS (Cro superfamily)